MSHLTAFVAAILLFTSTNRPGFESNYIIDATGKVTLTKQGQDGWWSVVGADEQGNILLDPSINWGEGFFKVQIAKNAAIRYINPTKIDGLSHVDKQLHEQHRSPCKPNCRPHTESPGSADALSRAGRHVAF